MKVSDLYHSLIGRPLGTFAVWSKNSERRDVWMWLLYLQYWYQAVVKGIVPWCFAIHEWCIAYDVRACSAMCVSWYIHWLWLCSPSLKSVHNSESKIRYVNNSCWKYSLISPALTAGANNCIFGDSVLTNSCKKNINYKSSAAWSYCVRILDRQQTYPHLTFMISDCLFLYCIV